MFICEKLWIYSSSSTVIYCLVAPRLRALNHVLTVICAVFLFTSCLGLIPFGSHIYGFCLLSYIQSISRCLDLSDCWINSYLTGWAEKLNQSDSCSATIYVDLPETTPALGVKFVLCIGTLGTRRWFCAVPLRKPARVEAERSRIRSTHSPSDTPIEPAGHQGYSWFHNDWAPGFVCLELLTFDFPPNCIDDEAVSIFKPPFLDSKTQLLPTLWMVIDVSFYLRKIWAAPTLTLGINPLTAELFNLNFNPLEVVSRWSNPQLQESENYSDLTKMEVNSFQILLVDVTFYL